MSRWADIDAIIDMSISVLCGGGNEEMAVLVEDINSIPSIEIIRCRECKYYNNDYTGEWCGRFRYPHGCRADAFCSYGEPKEKLKGSERSVKGSDCPWK